MLIIEFIVFGDFFWVGVIYGLVNDKIVVQIIVIVVGDIDYFRGGVFNYYIIKVKVRVVILKLNINV